MNEIFNGYADHFAAEVRLVLLKALAVQDDYRLNDSMLQTVLTSFAVNRNREFVRNELRWLQSSVGAVKITEVGTAMIAELTEAGLDHVERRRVLEGVKKPSPVRG